MNPTTSLEVTHRLEGCLGRHPVAALGIQQSWNAMDEVNVKTKASIVHHLATTCGWTVAVGKGWVHFLFCGNEATLLLPWWKVMDSPCLVASGTQEQLPACCVKGSLAARLETRIKESAAYASMVSNTYRHRQVGWSLWPPSC